ncbi:hypothetical protein ES705_18022 [subsurface metagenome]
MKLKFESHSVSDWDFTYGTSHRSLSAVTYVSPPTSLLLEYPFPANVTITVLCRLDATQVLPEGELRTWLYSKYGGNKPFIFRNQAALGSADNTNCYYLNFSSNLARLRRVIGGGMVEIGTWPIVYTYETWQHWRVVWWNGLTGEGVPALAVDLYKEVTGEWVKQGSTRYDTTNQWKESAINRCGLIGQTDQYMPVYLDDTEIWGPV